MTLKPPIRIKITVKNDHATYNEWFETDDIRLSTEDDQLVSMIEKVTKAFNQPVDEVKIRCSMEV